MNVTKLRNNIIIRIINPFVSLSFRKKSDHMVCLNFGSLSANNFMYCWRLVIFMRVLILVMK